MAAAAVRYGSRPCCARRCGPTTSPAAPQYMGVNWVGSGAHALRHRRAEGHGTCPPSRAGEVIWCQGFSEPEAGTDLASLRTRAVPDGDGWRDHRTEGLDVVCADGVLVRAGGLHRPERAEVPSGSRLFLVPMDRPGITVRPIRSMLGPHHLNEVFLDDVRGVLRRACSARSATAGG